jgi:hypothetical protein
MYVECGFRLQTCQYIREMSVPAVKLEQAKSKEAEVKEVSMDVAAQEGGGGGGKTRRRRRGGSRRRQKGGAAEEEGHQEGGYTATVQKEVEAPDVPRPAPTPTPTKPQTGGAVKKVAAPIVVIAPPKKKAPKVTLIPKATGTAKRAPVKKTFKAKRVRVLIKNRKTIKRQQQALQKVDALSDDAIRTAAVSAGLTRADANAPVPLLRTMLKDYQTMKGGFL